MQPKIWAFIIAGCGVPVISGCGGPIVSCAVAPPSQFQRFEITGATATIPTGINNSGDIVGYATGSRGMTRSFRGRPGSFTLIDPPPLPDGTVASSSEAYAINNRGNIIIIGHYPTGARSYLFNGTSFLPLPATGRPLDNPRGINDDPQVVGFLFPSQPPGQIGLAQGYVYDVNNSVFHGGFTVFDFPTYLTGMNDNHRKVGSAWTDAVTFRAFYLAGVDPPSAVLIDIPGGTESVGNGINNAADPGCTRHVGTYWTADGNSHGFVHLQAGQVATVDVPDAVQTEAYAVNDNGDIVGIFQDKGGVTRGFFAPAPL
jgi:probable HAF family extracellular repeat protein